MPGAILTIKPHLVWDGEVLNYISWRDLIDKELQDFQTEEKPSYFFLDPSSNTYTVFKLQH